MKRRTFLRTGAAVAAGSTLAAPTVLEASGSSFRASSHARNAGLKHSVCRWCYSGLTLEQLSAGARSIGMHSVELLNVEEFPVVKEYGLVCAMANGPTSIPDGFNRTEFHERFISGFKELIPQVAAAGFPNIICFSGNRRGMDDETGLENCVQGVQQVVGDAERHGVTICMELLNSKVDHPDYMCDHTEWGVELVKRVGSERFKLLYDIYHMQIMEGDVIRTIRENHEYIGHYHTGGNPGRNEIDETQELNYAAIMRAIRETGYTGYVGQEFIPSRTPLVSLREAVALCDV
jgi:hydroxypyruvate isomerase